MSRNGSGTMTIPNTLVAGTTITASDHNENYSDIATEITNSVAVDGQSTMTGQLKAASGTVAAPGITFGADTDSGLYRIGANNLGVAVGGTKIVDVASTGATIVGDMNATTVKQGGFSLLPVGVFFPYAGSSAPSGYLFCDGSAVSRTTYASLFSAIGTAYGTGDGSTTFNLPDLKGRVPAGKESSATRLTSTYFGGNSTALGATGGSESHTLTTAQLASHTHVNTLTDPGHTHSTNSVSFTGSQNIQSGSGANLNTSGLTSTSSTTGITITNASAGSGSAHNNVQPTIISNYIIFAGV